MKKGTDNIIPSTTGDRGMGSTLKLCTGGRELNGVNAGGAIYPTRQSQAFQHHPHLGGTALEASLSNSLHFSSLILKTGAKNGNPHKAVVKQIR